MQTATATAEGGADFFGVGVRSIGLERLVGQDYMRVEVVVQVEKRI